MFLHINTFGQQISLHSKDAEDAVPGTPATPEEKDDAGNVTKQAQPAVPEKPAKPAEPLKNVIQEALDYWKRTDTDIVPIANGKRLDLNKTALENGLTDNDFINVVSQESLDEALALKQEELDNAKKLAGKL